MRLPPDVIAAHESGHAVAAHVLGLTIEAVHLVPRGAAAARVTLLEGEFESLSDENQRLMALSGMAGERVALRKWSGKHLSCDIRLVRDWSGPPSIERSMELVQRHVGAFEAINSRLLESLDQDPPPALEGRVVHDLARDAGAQSGIEAL